MLGPTPLVPNFKKTVWCSGPGGGGDVPRVPRYLAVVGAAAGALTPRHPRLLRLLRRRGPRDAYQRVSTCIFILYTYCIHSLFIYEYNRLILQINENHKQYCNKEVVETSNKANMVIHQRFLQLFRPQTFLLASLKGPKDT